MPISKREYISTTFFLGRAMFLGVGFSYIFRYSGKDAWISILLGYLIGNIIIIFYDKISKNINFNLNNFLNKKTLISTFYKIIFFLLYIYLVIYISVIFTNFVKVYYLFETPIWVTLSLLFAVAFYTALKSEKTIIRMSVLLLPISLVINIFNTVFLSSFIDINNFLPILTEPINNIFIGALIFAIFSSVPNVLLMEYKVTLKTKMISYFIVFVIIFLINFYITGFLGAFLIKTYSYPEYMVLRRIQILDFIENIENFASIIWYFDAFILLSLSLSKVRKMFITKKKDILIPILLLIITVTAFSIFSKYYTAISNFFSSGIIILGIFLILSGPLLYLVTKRKK